MNLQDVLITAVLTPLQEVLRALILFVCVHAAHYEKLHFQLSKQYILDVMTGLLLIYPSCLLHVVEVSVAHLNLQSVICDEELCNPSSYLLQSSREVLLSVLRDLTELQQQAGW